ncbi:tRNA glutamyl-Q(34) synthetase GluQRS [Allorhizobium taibaishanense]|uniref:Glutamyl-Q tRNA(Asp) synthetase n=1 Tax=Allorhizobium taibaishanense TaxID=887144 RepID=A0A1Q9A1I9_9HYPH|nr:tRNA glutamyl-Q(34) synthetase GluQRS [Allorhizobium taibaishanense]MBB4009302.1 glutamyl-Q tRNA(Asp) synthetase [Allorhizobium taibaishanense]OLP48438.1 tRNA glutamyl-Q(34) synthetase GluQRS [Allorhizobium taibaishanense]
MSNRPPQLSCLPEPTTSPPVLRFAPSPNGYLHLGHALSALVNADLAQQTGGRLLLRIEDIDIDRCNQEFETAIHEDLAWLGLTFEHQVRRQSEHIDAYRAALAKLEAMDLIYPAFLSRAEIRRQAEVVEAGGQVWPRDPDGALHYPTDERHSNRQVAQQRIADGERHSLRLNMAKALSMVEGPLFWQEVSDAGQEQISSDPASWGDVILWRWDAPSSYHLSVVVDDALQGVTHVVRGADLFAATAVHRLLQHLLDLPAPAYTHHRLILGEDGRKLSKSLQSAGLRHLRAEGLSPLDIRRLVGL